MKGKRRPILLGSVVDQSGVQVFEDRPGLVEDAQVLLVRRIVHVEHVFTGVFGRPRAALLRTQEWTSEARILRRVPSSRQEVVESLLRTWP